MATQIQTIEAPAILATEIVTFMAGGNKGSRPVLRGKDLKPTFDKIPLVDLTNMNSAESQERQTVALEIKAAFTNVGFVYVENHGISQQLQADVSRVVKEFFALPDEEKMKVHVNKSPFIRGYEAMFETKIDPTSRGDLKEAFNFSEDPYEPEQKVPADFDWSPYPTGPMNQWPTEPKDFRSILSEYRDACLQFSNKLLQLIALSLDLDENYFAKLMKFPMSGMRPLHYPTQDIASDIGLGAHADYSWFTLVNQLSPVQALEVLNHNGHWVPAPPIPNTLVVNVGDFLERATNDLFQSTVHRVINRTGEERYSIPFFFSPSHEAIIEVVPTCVSEENPCRYEALKAGEWQQKRLLGARYKHPASIAARKA